MAKRTKQAKHPAATGGTGSTVKGIGVIDPKNPPAAGTVFVLDVPEGTENPTGESTASLCGHGTSRTADRFELEMEKFDEPGDVCWLDRRADSEYRDETALKAWNKFFAPFVVEVRPPGTAERKTKRPAGYFDLAEPWPEGSVVSFGDDSPMVLKEADLELGLLVFVQHDDDEIEYTVPDWNNTMARQVAEVRFPQSGMLADDKPCVQVGRLDPDAMRDESPPPSLRQKTPRADLVMIPIDRIDATHNIRTDMDEGFLLQLQASMKDVGMLQPVVVRKLSGAEGNGFRLIAGHQRLEAATRAGEEFVEAKLYAGDGIDDVWEAKARLAENIQRQDLNHIELAAVYGQAADAGLSVPAIAAQGHVSDDSVRRHLALRRLTKPVADLVAAGFAGKLLPVHQAELIARVGDPARQIRLAEQCLALGWDAKKGKWADRPHWGHRDGDPTDYVMTMDELRKAVATAMCGLAACGWLKHEDMSDVARGPNPETPISAAGGIAGQRACNGCPDNTLTYADHPVLFAGLRPQGSDKKGYCTNRPCYEAKTKAWDKVVEKRRKAKEKEQAKTVAKAKKAGLAVCEACARVLDEGFSAETIGGQKLCPKCAEKARKQTQPGGGRSYADAEKERKKLAAKFPWDDEQRHALATWLWGRAAAETIGDHIETLDWTGQHEAAAAICTAIGIRLALADEGDDAVLFDARLTAAPRFGKEDAAVAQESTATALATLWREAVGVLKPKWGQEVWHDYKPGIGHTGKPVNVPLPPAAVALVDLYEQLASRWKLFNGKDTTDGDPLPPRPRAGGDEAAGEAGNGPAKSGVCRVCDGKGGFRDPRQTLCMMCDFHAEYNAIMGHGKKDTVKFCSEAIVTCESRPVLQTCLDNDVKEKWRRDAITVRLDALTAAAAAGEVGGTRKTPRFLRVMGGPQEGLILRVVETRDDGAVEARQADGIMRLIRQGTATAPATASESAQWANERESRVLNLVRQGGKKEALAMIEINLADEGDWLTPADLLAVLKTAQSLGLKGDWRRAAVDRRIKELQADAEGGGA